MKKMDDLEKQITEAEDALFKEDYEKAFSIINPLVVKDEPAALGLLGLMYQIGMGVDRDLSRAVKLLTSACEKGNGTAAHNLGTIYEMGEEEIPKDHEKSKMYYRKAKELGAQFAPDDFYE